MYKKENDLEEGNNKNGTGKANRGEKRGGDQRLKEREDI